MINGLTTDRGAIIEKRQYIKRITFAVGSSIITYILLLLIMFFAGNFKQKKDEIPVVTVRLTDKIFEEIKNMDQKQKEKFIKKQRNIIKKKKKKANKQRNKETNQKNTHNENLLNNNSQNNQENIKKNNDTSNAQEDSNTKTTVPINESNNQNDLWADYTQKEKEQKNKIESDFYDSNNDKNNKSTTKDNYINELDNLDNLLQGLEENQNTSSNNTNSDDTTNISKNDGDISWTTGRKRKLIENPKFDIPEKFKKTGQKYSIKLKFTVLESGLVQKVDIIESTGYPELDAYIVSKFKQRKFEKAEGIALSEGEIKINIGY